MVRLSSNPREARCYRKTGGHFAYRVGHRASHRIVLIGIFAIPPLYVMFQPLRERLRKSARPTTARTEEPYRPIIRRLMSEEERMTNRQRRHVFPVSAFLVGTCLLQPAFGQINPFRGSTGEPMRQDDIDALTDATNRLLDRPQLVPGGTETWSNPKSGASGTITAGQPVSRHNLSCRNLQYQIIGPGTRPERNYSTTWCKTPDGWKLG